MGYGWDVELRIWTRHIILLLCNNLNEAEDLQDGLDHLERDLIRDAVGFRIFRDLPYLPRIQARDHIS